MLKKSFFFVVLFLLLAFVVFATIPQKINYQGYLTDSGGTPLTTTTPLEMTFSIYNSEITSTFLWQATYKVNIAEGRFDLLLGDPDHLGANKEIPYSVFDGNIKYLGIKIGTDPEMTPRKKLTSVAYSYKAHNAQQLDGKEPSDFIQKLDNVTPNSSGNIDLIAGSNVSITPDATGHKITISSSGGSGGGDITAVKAGNGLSGGGTSGDVTVNVGAGTGITVNSNDVALKTSYTDGLYVNEGQSNSITSTMIKDGEVNEGDIKTNAVTTPKIKNNAVTKEKITPDFVSSVDGVKNDGGNIDLVGGSNITITPDDGNNKITISASSSGDNLGNHTATQNIKLNGKWLSNDGGNEGLKIDNSGKIITSGDIIVDDDISVGGDVEAQGYIITGTPTIPYGDGDIVATDDVFADDLVIARGIQANDDLHAGDDITAGDHISADDDIAAYGTVYGYSMTNGSFGVYGQRGSNYGKLGTSSDGVYGQSYNGSGSGLAGIHNGSGNGVYGRSSSGYAGYFSGKARVTGTLSKGGGSFTIDHPLDPENKYLQHSFVESPDMKNVYDGVVILDSNGEATVKLANWFGALNKDFRYQLTAIGAPGPNLYVAEKISNNQFRIAGVNPGMEVSWLVTGIRKDAFANSHRIQVELEKTGKEKGKYIHPKEHGVSEIMGIEYEITKKMEEEHKKMEEEHQRMELEHKRMEEERENEVK